MIYVGKTLTLNKDPLGIAELIFDRKDSSVNKLDGLTLHELHDAIGKPAAGAGSERLTTP